MTRCWSDSRIARTRSRGGRAPSRGAATWTGRKVCGVRPWNGIPTIPSFWSGWHRPSTGRVNPISRRSMRRGRARSRPRTARRVISREPCAPHSGRRSRRTWMERATRTTMISWRRRRRSPPRSAPICAARCARAGDTPPILEETARATGGAPTSSRRWDTAPCSARAWGRGAYNRTAWPPARHSPPRSGSGYARRATPR